MRTHNSVHVHRLQCTMLCARTGFTGAGLFYATLQQHALLVLTIPLATCYYCVLCMTITAGTHAPPAAS
jgi:hypothetical protein